MWYGSWWIDFFLKHWEGPSLDPTYRNYVWTLLADLLFGAGVLHGWYFICFDLIFYTSIILIPPFISMYIMTLHCIYCTFQSRILACWLMLSVAKTTINKVYLILSDLMITSSNGNIFRVTGPGGFLPQMRTFETNDWANSPCAFVNVFLVWKLYFDSSFNLKCHPFHGYLYHVTPWKKLL